MIVYNFVSTHFKPSAFEHQNGAFTNLHTTSKKKFQLNSSTKSNFFLVITKINQNLQRLNFLIFVKFVQ